jgi:hypothetical protein
MKNYLLRTIFAALSVVIATPNAQALTSDCVSMSSEGQIYGGSTLSKVERPYGITSSRHVFEPNAVAIKYMKSGGGFHVNASIRITSNCGLLTPRMTIDMPVGFSQSDIQVTEHSYNESTKQLSYSVRYFVSAEALLADKVRGLMKVNFNLDFSDRSGVLQRSMYLESDNTPPAPLRAEEVEVVDLDGTKVFNLVDWNGFKMNRDDGSLMVFISSPSLNVYPWYMCNGVIDGPSSCYPVSSGNYEFTILDEAGNRSAPASLNLISGGGGTAGGGTTTKGNGRKK